MQSSCAKIEHTDKSVGKREGCELLAGRGDGDAAGHRFGLEVYSAQSCLSRYLESTATFLKSNKFVSLFMLNTPSGFAHEPPGCQYSTIPLSSAEITQSYRGLYAIATTGFLCTPFTTRNGSVRSPLPSQMCISPSVSFPTAKVNSLPPLPPTQHTHRGFFSAGVITVRRSKVTTSNTLTVPSTPAVAKFRPFQLTDTLVISP